MKNVLIIVAVLILAGLGYYSLMDSGSSELVPAEQTPVADEQNTDVSEETDVSDMSEDMEEGTTEDDMMDATTTTEDGMMDNATMTEDEMTDDTTMTEEESGDSTDADSVKEFTLDSFNYGYSQDEIVVEEGDVVTITLTNSDGFHDWVVDEFDAATEKINEGETTQVTFTADAAGEYEFYCSVGNHRAQGMVGTLVVEPATE